MNSIIHMHGKIAARSRLVPAGRALFRQSLRSVSSNYVILADDQSFDKIKSHPGKKVLYFTATWCPPCRMIAPIFENMSKTKENISFIKIDVDKLPQTAQTFNITSVPTFCFQTGSKTVAKFSGAVEASLKNYVEELDRL